MIMIVVLATEWWLRFSEENESGLRFQSMPKEQSMMVSVRYVRPPMINSPCCIKNIVNGSL